MKKKKEVLIQSTIPHYEIITKTVKEAGSSGRLYTPINWSGCRVAMLRLDPIENDEE